MTNFVNLHNQTDYSILDSLISPKDLFNQAKILGQTSVAVTDHGTLASAWDSWKASKETGVKLIIGCECYFKSDINNPDEKFRHIVLIAKNAIGYRNLLTINKKGFDQGSFLGKRVYSVIDWKLLEQYHDGLICLTACGNGIISQLLMSKKTDEAEQTLLKLKNIFQDNLGIEIQANNMKRGSNIYNDEIDQQFLNRKLIDLGKKHNIKIVATCNAHYLKKEDSEVHDTLLAIGSHQPVYSNFRLKYPVSDFYLKSGDEVKSFFSRNYGDELSEEFCLNSIYFESLCEQPNWIDPKFSNPSGKELPVFPVKDEPNYQEFISWVKNQNFKLDEDKAYLRYKINSIFERKIIEDKLTEEQIPIYKDRIANELDVLESLDISSYMLITADFLDYARKNNISVGPGRGSAGGSYVAYLLNIHCADSIKYDLVFERFHNKLKKATSDIDNDLAPSGRNQVIKYVVNKYGSDNVAHVSNFNKNTPKVYIKDISRAYEFGGSKTDSVRIGMDIASVVSADIHSIEDALIKAPLFGEYCKKYPQLIKCLGICNKPRAVSTHAAGVVVAKRPLLGLVPLRKDKDNNTSLEYDKDQAEDNGLVKIDFLGLNTLDIISKTFELIKESGKEIPNINFEEYDQKTYDLISNGDTFGVFQFGTSGGTIDLCKKIKPKTIEDLAIITTLARPASREIRSDFIKTRNGLLPVSLLHPLLENAFKKTYGFPLYDESLLILAKDIAGWDLDEADKLRKLTKEKGKNPKKVKQWRQEFISGAVKNGLTEEIGNSIWETIIEPFGKYSFNKSHAVLYSIISYQTAYLKANFPIEFLLANLMAETKSNSPDAKNNIEKIKNEIRVHNVNIIPPNINSSELTYTICGDKLLTGLDALKFVSDDAIKDIIEKRPFKDFFDFMVRVDSRKVRANTIQALAMAGSIDSFNISRKLIYLYCSDYRKKLQVWLKKHDPNKDQFIYPWPIEADWKISELYALEQFYLNEAFICKPCEAYGKFFKDEHKTVQDIKKAKDKAKLYPIKGIVKNFFEFKVKKETSKYYGQSMIKAVIEDMHGDSCTCTIFPDKWKIVQNRIKEVNSKAIFDVGIALSFGGAANNYDDNMGIILDDLFNISIIPALPADLKAKKVNLKESKNKTSEIDLDKNPNDTEGLLENIEDILYDAGLIDLNDEIDI